MSFIKSISFFVAVAPLAFILLGLGAELREVVGPNELVFRSAEEVLGQGLCGGRYWSVCLLAVNYAAALLFLANLRSNPGVPAQLRPVWAVLILASAPFALPVYWYAYLYRVGNVQRGDGKSL